MRERITRMALVVTDLFAAVSAFAGALGLVVGYMQIPLSVLHRTPFADFTVPALLLGVIVGGSALAAALIVLYGPRKIELLASVASGCILVGWMTVELAMIGLGIWVQPFYLGVGVLMIALAVLAQ